MRPRRSGKGVDRAENGVSGSGAEIECHENRLERWAANPNGPLTLRSHALVSSVEPCTLHVVGTQYKIPTWLVVAQVLWLVSHKCILHLRSSGTAPNFTHTIRHLAYPLLLCAENTAYEEWPLWTFFCVNFVHRLTSAIKRLVIFRVTSWRRSIVVRTLVSAGELSLSCARLLAGCVTTLRLKTSPIGQPTWPTQPSIPQGSVNE